MDLYKDKYRIPSARLQTWNYADNGMYFITICTANRECYFGDVIETGCPASSSEKPKYEMRLNDLGRIVETEWLKTPGLRPDMNLELAEHVVMPNHFHGIIWIGDNQYNSVRYDLQEGDAMHRVPTDWDFTNIPKSKFGSQSKNLASITRGFKSSVTTYARNNNIEFN